MNRAEAIATLTTVSYRGWRFSIGEDGDRLYLHVAFQADGAVQHGRKWWISPHMTKSELVQTALKAVLTAEEHEVREHFQYRGRPIFGPHFDVDALWELADGRHNETRATFMADPLKATGT